MGTKVFRAVCVLAATCAFAWAQPVARLTTPHVDLGVVTTREDPTFELVLRNDGDQPLLVSSIHPGCGCTTLEGKQGGFLIGDGQRRAFRFRFTAYGSYGPFRKSVTFTTNDPHHPTLDAEFVGTSEPPVSCAVEVRVEAKNRLSIATRRIEVKYNDPVEVPAETSFYSDNSWLTAHWVSLDRKSGQGTVEVIVDSKGIPPDLTQMSGFVDFRTGAPKFPVVRLHVLWAIHNPFSIQPAQVIGKANPGTQPAIRVVVRSERPYRAMAVTSGSPDFFCRLVEPSPTEAGLTHDVEIIPTRPLADGDYKEVFHLTTDSASVPDLVGTFSYEVRRGGKG